MNVLVLSAFLMAPAPADKPAAEDAGKPTLIAKHKDGLVHAVPLVLPPPPPPPALRAPGRGPLLLTYTALATGEMQVLTASGDWSVPGPPMGIDRIFHTRMRLAGATADADQLYVVRLTTTRTELVTGGTRSQPEKVKYELLVYRLADGSKLHTLEMKEGDFPKEEPSDTVQAGPLKVVDGGVTCYGVTFTFKGKDATQRYDKKKD